MKKKLSVMFAFSCAFMMICFAFLGAKKPADSVSALPKTAQAAAEDKTTDDLNYANFRGRLTIPDAKIDVALYGSSAQAVCDRWDSACCFRMRRYSGIIIADHNTQEFATLPDVEVGTRAEIKDQDGNVTVLECAKTFNGHNTGSVLTDENGNVVLGKYDYVTYTCRDSWKNVRICQWQIVE